MRTTWKYIFIAMKEEGINIEGFIKEKCQELGIANYHLILLDYLTDGQATTATLAEKYWNQEHALLIYNIDTYVEPGQMNSEELKGDGFIPCFKAEGDHWSFVRLDEQDRVVEIREKQRISDHCTLGAYYFKTCGLYKKLYDEYYSEEKNLVKGEKYVAPCMTIFFPKAEKFIFLILPRKGYMCWEHRKNWSIFWSIRYIGRIVTSRN